MPRIRSISSCSDHFHLINERPVDDISLEFFYKPHSITLLTVSILAVLYFALTRDDNISVEANYSAGFLCVSFFCLVLSVLAFPNGPFTRPHPALWRMVFGLSVLYLLTLIWLLFQDYNTIRSIFLYYFPKLKEFRIDMEKEYGVNCWDVSLDRIWGHFDVFAVAHVFGCCMTTLVLRHYGLMWTLSVMWEITEVVFAHLLPNFLECWWDQVILDVLLFNGLGIWTGMTLCKMLEMREYKWESIKDIQSTTGKIKRAVLQFTPESWTHVRWLDPNSSYMRMLAILQLLMLWQLSGLNTFFLKHIFHLPPSHPLVWGRILLHSLIFAPSIRQYYTYVTDTRCKRLGTQCWVSTSIELIEALMCIKFGSSLFKHTDMLSILAWLIFQCLLSALCVYLCALWAKRNQESTKRNSVDWINGGPCSLAKVNDKNPREGSDVKGGRRDRRKKLE